MAVQIEVIRTHPEPRVRAFHNGSTVIFRPSCGWTCSCNKGKGSSPCKHMRAVQRELPQSVLDAIESYAAPLGWSA